MAEPWEGNGLVWGGLRFLSKTKVAVLGMTAVLFWPVVPAGSSLVPLWENREQLAQQEGMPADSTRREAERLLEEGLQLYQQRTAESLRQAIQKWEEALPLIRAVGDKEWEAWTLTGIGKIYSDLGDKQKALDYYNQSLPLSREVGYKEGEAATLYNIGGVYSDLGDKQKALSYYNQALSLYRAVGDRAGEAKTLYNAGLVYQNSGEYPKALDYLKQALAIYETAGSSTDIANTLNNLGTTYILLSDYQKAIDSFNQALPLYQDTGDREGVGRMLVNLGVVYIEQHETQKALDFFNQALLLWQELKDQRGEAFALSNIGNVYNNRSEYQRALNYYNQGLSLYRAIGEREQEAYVLNQIGLTHEEMGEMQQAIDAYEQAFPILRALGNRAREAVTLNNIGSIYLNIGDYQQAFDAYTQALPIFRSVGNHLFEAKALSNIGNIYNILGEQQKALEYYNQALALHRTVGDKEGEALTLNNLGGIYGNSGDIPKAREYYNQALQLLKSVGSRYGEAITLNNIGNLYDDSGEHLQALEYHNQALSIRQNIGDRSGEAYTLHNIGAVYQSLGEYENALEKYKYALFIRQAIGDDYGESLTLTNIAFVERNRGNLNEALNQIKAAAEIIENLRTNIGSSELRASFFATQQDTFGLYIDILMALHKQNPNAGYDIAAFDVSERARARSLLELLNEARADIRQGVNPELREEERRLLQLLDSKRQYQIELSRQQSTDEQKETIRQEIAELETQLQQVEAQIRATSPRYAALTQPQPLTLKEVQQQIVDADSILLSYWLGEERSYLWVITPTSFTVRELPKRADIETAAQEFIDYLAPVKSGSANAEVKAATLSKIILAPVAEQLQQKRLLIVADGGLQYVPFSALPVPVPPAAETTQLLIAEHEIISLPSASTLSIIRRDTADRQPAPKAVAVLADPVFSAEDSRVNGTPTPQTPPLFTPNLTRGTDSEGADWARLLGTRQEAERILSLVVDSEKMQAFDFDANLDQATDSVLSNYRIVHFATHGFLNSENPQLSGIVFSLVNQFGVPQDGYLLTPAVFNLNLPAELVVLSGCETGKGNKVKGEGIVGLTRGFMYAGAKRVMVSLWSVSDQQGTPELMSRFYQKMLQEGLPPAQALREAQLSMIGEGKEPHYWAPFILQGEWK